LVEADDHRTSRSLVSKLACDRSVMHPTSAWYNAVSCGGKFKDRSDMASRGTQDSPVRNRESRLAWGHVQDWG
jgi:hypothetical protein